MQYTDYRENVKRTLPDLGSVLLNSIHMVLGLASEIEELNSAIEKKDVVNVGEEITDMLWYASNYCNIHNIDTEAIRDDDLWRFFDDPILISAKQQQLIIKDIVNRISELSDLDKKLLAYSKPVNHEDRQRLIVAIILFISDLYDEFNLDAEKCMQNNIDKLRIRFPDKFSNDNANNRDLEKERRELEK